MAQDHANSERLARPNEVIGLEVRNQWSSCRSGIMWSYFRVENIRHAAAFVTDWFLASKCLGRLAKSALHSQPRQNKLDNKWTQYGLANRLTDAANLSHGTKTAGDGTHYVTWHRKIWINVDAKISHRPNWCYCVWTHQVNEEWIIRNPVLSACWCAP